MRTKEDGLSFRLIRQKPRLIDPQLRSINPHALECLCLMASNSYTGTHLLIGGVPSPEGLPLLDLMPLVVYQPLCEPCKIAADKSHARPSSRKHSTASNISHIGGPIQHRTTHRSAANLYLSHVLYFVYSIDPKAKGGRNKNWAA